MNEENQPAAEENDPQLQPEVASSAAEAAAVGDSTRTVDVDGLEQLRSQLAEAEKQALRYQADLENFRKRKNREAQEQLRYASLPLIQDILGVVDNLERALGTVDASTDDGLVQGVRMVAHQMMDVLKQHGCQPIESLGQPFDPNVHEALELVEASDVEPGMVVAERQSGFRLHERVVRSSKVVVSKATEN